MNYRGQHKAPSHTKNHLVTDIYAHRGIIHAVFQFILGNVFRIFEVIDVADELIARIILHPHPAFLFSIGHHTPPYFTPRNHTQRNVDKVYSKFHFKVIKHRLKRCQKYNIDPLFK